MDFRKLENDMENYMQYKIMGSVKRIRLKPDCIPSRFDCQEDRKHKLTPSEPRSAFMKRQKISFIQDIERSFSDGPSTSSLDQNLLNQENCLPSCSSPPLEDKFQDKAVQAVPHQEHKSIQAHVTHYRSKMVQISANVKDTKSSPIKFTLSTATSPLITKMSEKRIVKPSTSGQLSSKRKLNFLLEEKYDSDVSYTPSLAGSSLDSSPLKPSGQDTSDSYSQKVLSKELTVNLPSNLSKIKKKPRLYIGIPKELYVVIDFICKHTDISEQDVLLCLMKVRLNKTFSQLADDFDVSLSQASRIFFNKMPYIVEVLIPFIKTFTARTIKKSLPIAFRYKYNKVTCIIDCLEIEIQKPKKAIHQALIWSEYKKTNTIKYLVACTPDGLVNFVSKGYGGRISDVNLVEHSRFLDTLKPNSCILADRGFKHIEVYLAQRGFTLLRPPSVATGEKMTKDEARQTKQIASLWIHVERVIRRIREFSMLKMHSVINLNLINVLDLCITTACALVNLQDALIK